MSCVFLAVLQSLKESFDEALQRDDVKAIVVAGKLKEITLKIEGKVVLRYCPILEFISLRY